ncbi:MaoC/PaaZ C-terminal domain-containing protein [Mycobacteroides salmoniphilum]|uniref:Bifunctional enoyl-CoA hydratase/phosphate acetyltransferase n=1 Tax=Mycobacteroides salmoniphilum TaxID=404941 RepID=A0A4R8SHN7_9MYCO|nr:MaoC/PaaZ C-terminal domain-containing protein [Mycobacteroides salmoniphilum]TDZ76365.1 bifunctional enoyl-CoA hydratase/phosphate acetyltransferase [Mycobacteroides salmoniphilum]TDZ84883.1 bifunctional enoyl-CoA hydratase/phosphate acetyltransferase [Mycobacteroides salmoniphilum]TDZ96451.1 bifunctional enoyl-CoA hydratase/phosphate acetyltransferase [Mycobacteroides salmoniphilum]TEA05546.1 bifunctional enoyl-CoA hydratase/phosphate acetyltransferase [Mycobacteroides salmoniphilum]
MGAATTQPSGLRNMAMAAVGALPFIPRPSTLPSRVVRTHGVRIDPAHVAAYAKVTGLSFTDKVPVTYPFALQFPSVMELVTGFDFPFPAIGTVHLENHITQHRAITATDTVDIEVRTENLREHRKGLLVDVLTDITIGTDTVWQQTMTFLRQQRTSLSDGPKSEPPKAVKLPPPNSTLRISGGQIRRYASVGGDHNPIHTSSIGAKALGFPKAIAHGMFTAAAVLGNIQGEIPDAVRYDVKFGKPILLPASVGVWIEKDGNGWDIAVRNPKKGDPHLNGTITPL